MIKKIFSLFAAILFAGSMWGANYAKTAISDITATDVVIIVGTTSNGNSYAMKNTGATSSGPEAISVTITDDVISTDATDILWNISKDGDNLTLRPNGDTKNVLYCISNNNGLRIAGSTASGREDGDDVFVLDNTYHKDNNPNKNYYLKSTKRTRWIGIYNTSNWRSYTSINSNIGNQSFAFYVLQSTPSTACATPSFDPAAGAVLAGTEVEILCKTEGATIHYTTDGTEPTASSATYSAAIPVNSAMTIKAIAVKAGLDNSSVASAAYTVLTPLTTMDQIFAAATSASSTATLVAVTFNNWVVTGVKNSNAYVTDGTKGFIVYTSSHGFQVGDILSGTAVCRVQLYNGSAELTELTASKVTVNTGGSVSPVVLDAEGIAALSGVNTGSLIKISGVASVSSDKYYVAGVQLYNSLYSFTNPTSGKSYDVTGVYLQYNSTKEIMPRSAEDIKEFTPVEESVVITSTSIDAPVDGKSGTINVTYNNVDKASAVIAVVEADGTTPATYSWLTTSFDEDKNVEYEVAANTGEARKAYLKVQVGDVKSALVTITQAKYVVPYATLPFAFEGGVSDIAETSGLTQSGLGSYSSAPYLKFDGTGDYLILQINEDAGVLAFDIKGNSFSNGTFTVQTSEDGETYTDLKAYTELGNTQTEILKIEAGVRFIKWIYTEKKNGNVALGNISVSKDTYEIKWSLGAGADENLGVLGKMGDSDSYAKYFDKEILNAGTYDVKLYKNGAATPIATTTLLIEQEEAKKYYLQFDYNASTGEFTATASNPRTATSVDNTVDGKKAVKFIENGQLFIELNGHIYNVQGQTVK